MAAAVTLLDNEQSGGMTHQIEIKAEDLTEATADTAQTFDIATLQEGDYLMRAGYHLKEAFEDESDAAFNSTTIEVGDEDDPNAALTAKQLNANGTEVLASITPNSLSTVPKSYVAEKKVQVTINSMAAKSLVNLDKGRIVVQVAIGQISQFSRSA